MQARSHEGRHAQGKKTGLEMLRPITRYVDSAVGELMIAISEAATQILTDIQKEVA